MRGCGRSAGQGGRVSPEGSGSSLPRHLGGSSPLAAGSLTGLLAPLLWRGLPQAMKVPSHVPHRSLCRGQLVSRTGENINRVVAVATKVGVLRPGKPAAKAAEAKVGGTPAVHLRVVVRPVAWLLRATANCHRDRPALLGQNLSFPPLEASPLVRVASLRRSGAPQLL